MKDYFKKHPFFKKRKSGTFGSNLGHDKITESDLNAIKNYYELNSVSIDMVGTGTSVFDDNLINVNTKKENFDGNVIAPKGKNFYVHQILLTLEDKLFFRGKIF